MFLQDNSGIHFSSDVYSVTGIQVPYTDHLNPFQLYTCIHLFLVYNSNFETHLIPGFEQQITACCGYGGPPLNFANEIRCGRTVILNGTSVTAKGCDNSTKYVIWDGIHYTEAANRHVSSEILTGKYSDPPFTGKLPFPKTLEF